MELGDLVGQAQLANNLGGIAYFDGRWQDTLEYYAQASEASRRVGDFVRAAWFEGNSAEVLVSQGRVSEAEPLLRNSSRVLRSSGSPWLASFAELQLGRVLTIRGEYASAETLLRTLLAECYQMGVPASAYEVALHLAECLIEQGRVNEALPVIEDAVGRNSEDVSIFEGAEARIRARVAAHRGRRDEAIELIARGVAATRARTLEYDLCRLLRLANDLGLEDEQISKDVRGEISLFVERLGIHDERVAVD